MTTTPPSTALSELTEAMVKAVPELFSCANCQHRGELHIPTRIGNKGCSKKYYGSWRNITIEDTLRAYRRTVDETRWEKFATGRRIVCSWHLGLPLHQQSEECLNFLHSLLCQTK